MILFCSKAARQAADLNILCRMHAASIGKVAVTFIDHCRYSQNLQYVGSSCLKSFAPKC